MAVRATVLAGALALAGCVTDEAARGPAPTVSPSAAVNDAPPPAVMLEDQTDAPPRPKTEVFKGSDTFVNPPPRPRPSGGEGEVSLDFTDAEIKDVIRTVLGEILKVPYSIDPQVQGKVTLRTSKPLRRDDVIAALETALKANNAVIVLADNVYNVVPAADAKKRVDRFEITGSARARMPGFGVEIVPLRFIAAEEMKKILESVAPEGSILSTDPARNLLFLAGTAQERASMLETIRLFDVSQLKGMSYALVRPEHLEATALERELRRVFETTMGASASLIRFVPLTRLNTLLVVSPRASLLDDVTTWVARLDAPPSGPGRRIYYYRMQNAKAVNVARSIAAVYGNVVSFDEGAATDEPSQGAAPSNGEPPPPPLPLPSPVPSGSGRGSGPQVAVDASNNALIIRADATEYAALERLLREIDVAPDQVVIEITIAEVTLNDTLKYGVEWFFRNADQTYQLSKTAEVSPVFPGFNFTYTVPDVDVAINALDTVTDVRIVSAPKLLTLDNKTATLQVGDQVPIVTQSATGIREATDPTIVNSVQFRDTGIVLKVTPRIGKSGNVFVEVNQEVSTAVPTTTSGIDSPTIQQRKLSSTVAVQDGDSIALGGLIRQSTTYGDSGVPVLKDIPLLGKLFSSTSDISDRTELLIFLRPRIIRSAAAAREITNELRRGLSGLDPLIDAAQGKKK